MKKQNQLGMNPSTASGRLVKDILFKFVQMHHPNCFRCNLPMTRETFSIEHKTPWLDSDDPVGLYFDLNNIDFSHHSCNVREARSSNKKYNTDEEWRAAKAEQSKAWRQKQSKEFNQQRRHNQYVRTGR